MAFGQAAGPRWLFIKREAAKRKHKTRKALPFRLASKLAFKAVSLLEDRTRWPFYQCRSNRMAKPPDFNADSLLSRFSAKASPMGVLSTRGPMAVLSKQKQPDGQTSRFQQQFAFSLLSRAINLSAAGQASLGKSRPSGRFITGGPMAVLSNQKQPDGQTSRFQRQIAFSLLSCTISLSAAGPSYSQQKQAQWPYYQRKAQWPFHQGRSNRMARPQISLPARAKLFAAKAGPMAVLSTRCPIGFIKAEATGWADLQISATNCIFAIIPHDQFISGRAKLFSAKAGPMAVLSTRGPMAVLSKQKQPDGQTSRFQRQFAFSLLSRPSGRFINAEAAGWPDLQISATNCIFAIIPHDQFISGRAKLFSAKAGPIAILSTRGPMAVLSRAG